MRLVFAGTPATALPSLDALAASTHDVVAVVTRPDAPTGRGRSLARSPVRDRAEELGMRVLTPVSPREPEFQAELRSLAPDVCPVVAYGALIPRSALDIPRLGWVNLHFSLLPAWRGAAPVQHSILAGDDLTGATTFVLEEGLDTGPVLGTMTETIRPSDTSGELLGRLAAAGAGLMVATMDGLASGDLVAKAQPAEGVSLAPKITVDDARIDWSRPAHVVDRLVRACTPKPGAWTTFRGERLKVLDQRFSVGDVSEPPGTVLARKQDVAVTAGAGTVWLETVQPQGKKAMRAADWARGVRVTAGERLGDA